jgi:plastocyanin
MSRALGATLSLLLLVACGGDASTTVLPPRVTEHDAEVAATTTLAFDPDTVTIQRGGTVTFDFESVGHNVFFDNAPPGAPDNITGSNVNVSKTLTFATTGTFVYTCHIHPGMRGTVIVVAP